MAGAAIFRVATIRRRAWLERVETPPLPAAQRQALASLLDDSAPAVRQMLLTHFAGLGTEGTLFLREVACGSNRVLAGHAAWFLHELKCADPVADFRGFIRSQHYELESGALLLARTVRPELDAGACCTQLDALAARVRALLPAAATAREQCRVLNRVLFTEAGFRGNEENYTDPRNSFLDQVLARRTGLPVSLAIVYLLVAGRTGIELAPVGAPGRFLVGCYCDAEPFFIDVFAGGEFLSAGAVFALLRAADLNPQISDLAPTPVREVFCRCCRNLVNHYTAAHEPELAQLFAGFVAEFEAVHGRPAQS